jgi:hypothetical protein
MDGSSEILKRASKLVWFPQKGPQEDLLKYRSVPEILFGGARGGGKTAALLGDFVSDVSVYKQHWIGMLFRRTYPELEEVIRQSFEFYPQTGASYNANEKVWKWPNGAKLYLRFMGHPRDAANYQGHQMCLVLGEKVLTRTGSKAIEDLRVGDLVMTGSGYHRVLGITAPVDKPCVKVQKSDGTFQVHPVDHEILCDSGWQSYSSLVGITSKEIQEKLQEFYTLPSVDALARCVKRVPLVSKLEGQTSNGSCEVCKSSELSRENILTSLRRFVGRFLGRQQQQLQHSQRLDYKSLPTVFDAKNCVPKCFPSPANFQVDCHLSARLHDEQPPLEREIDQDAFPLPNGAEKPRLNCCSEDVQDNTHICNHSHFSKYPHPYVGLELPMAWENSLEACSFSYVGVKTCVDIHVESVNNYISASTGFLNKNCWIGFDELGNFATDEGFTQMIACLRSPHDVPHKRIRCTANPGGVGHGWVKARYGIAENPQGYKLLEQDTGLHRMFIPSRVTDNQILMKADPTYVQRLHEIGSPEMVRAWLHGDWDVVAGAYFPEFSQEHVIDAIDPDDIPNHWKIYRAYDHGTYHPFAVLWYTYAGEDWRGIKKGSIVILREWYGGNDKDEGLKMSLVDIRDGITERESTIKRRIEPGPADNQIFENHGGQSIADALAIAGVYFSRSDKSRIPGWNQIRMRLREKSLLFTRSCKHLLRTFPMLQHDDRRPEDVDTQGADHLADVLRYISMQWPIIPRFDKKKRRDPNAVTYSDLVEAVDDVSNRWRI